MKAAGLGTTDRENGAGAQVLIELRTSTTHCARFPGCRRLLPTSCESHPAGSSGRPDGEYRIAQFGRILPSAAQQ